MAFCYATTPATEKAMFCFSAHFGGRCAGGVLFLVTTRTGNNMDES